MAKKNLGSGHFLYPMPAVLVGANVGGKPNYMTAAFCGVVNLQPSTLCVSLNEAHYTVRGIRENKTFSVNVPSVSMARAVDYCGINSGHKVDKTQVFETFYGELGTAPMAGECPVCLECRLIHEVELSPDTAFFGEVVGAHAEEDCLVDGKPDMMKVAPLVYSVGDRSYYRMGERVGPAWQMGKDYKK